MRKVEWACVFICPIVLSPLHEELLYKYSNASFHFNRLDNLKLLGSCRLRGAIPTKITLKDSVFKVVV